MTFKEIYTLFAMAGILIIATSLTTAKPYYTYTQGQVDEFVQQNEEFRQRYVPDETYEARVTIPTEIHTLLWSAIKECPEPMDKDGTYCVVRIQPGYSDTVLIVYKEYYTLPPTNQSPPYLVD